MASSFFSTPGCVYRSGSGGGSGIYKMSPSPESSSGGGVGGTHTIISGVMLHDRDALGFSPLLSGQKVIYSFGPDTGDIGVSLLLLLGQGSSGGRRVGSLVGFFQGQRVSSRKSPVRISVGGSGYAVALHGIRIEGAQAEINVQGAALIGSIIDPP